MQRIAVIIGSYPAPLLPRSDRAAIGLALQRFGGPLHAYHRHDDEAAWRYALAAGATTATPLHDPIVIDFDVALVGSGGAEPWGDMLLALLAEQKQCAMVLEVLDFHPGPQGLMIRRDLGRGSREILTLSGPVVLGMAEAAPQGLYVSRYRRQAVRAPLPLADALPDRDPLAAVSGSWEPARPRARTANLEARTGGPASARLQALLGMSAEAARPDEHAHVMVADAATCAQHLLRFLRHHHITATPLPPSPAAPAPTLTPSLALPPQGGEQRWGGLAAPIWAPHQRGPRPLTGDRHGMERWPRPLQPDEVPLQTRLDTSVRSPRPVGQHAPQRARGPRPVVTGPGEPEERSAS